MAKKKYPRSKRIFRWTNARMAVSTELFGERAIIKDDPRDIQEHNCGKVEYCTSHRHMDVCSKNKQCDEYDIQGAFKIRRLLGLKGSSKLTKIQKGKFVLLKRKMYKQCRQIQIDVSEVGCPTCGK